MILVFISLGTCSQRLPIFLFVFEENSVREIVFEKLRFEMFSVHSGVFKFLWPSVGADLVRSESRSRDRGLANLVLSSLLRNLGMSRNPSSGGMRDEL